jgi:hypothetical protein
MTGISVTFARKIAPAISEPERHRIDAALSRIAIGDPPGRWPERPSGIVVTDVLADGRSGARVLRLEVRRGMQRQYQIAKVSPLADAQAEWRAFADIVERTRIVLCPPIEAVTEGILNPQFALPGEDEAVVYTDVEQFAGAATSNLEDLVAAAVAGEAGSTDTVVTVISRLFHLAGLVFYARCDIEPGARLRREANLSLGPDLRIATQDSAISRWPPGGGPVPRTAGRVLVPGDILAAALDLPDAGHPLRGAAGSLVGSPVAVAGLRPRRDDDRLIATREFVAVELIPAGDLAALSPGGGPLYVQGTVTGTRSALTWERVARALPGVRVVAPGVVELERTQVAHPFAALRRVLLEPVSGLITSCVHGDLNARNVLIADGRPYLIDYARALPRQPILGDFAWLETNLLRGPLAAALSFAELVQAGRLLALGDRVASLLPDDRHAEVIGALIADCRPPVAAAIRMLAAIRRHARLSYAQAERSAGPSGEPWWREYAAQLILATHRTFKWPDEMQTEATWRAMVATAAVASEQLTSPGNPWRFWDHPSLAAATAAVLPLLPGETATFPVLAGLLAGIEPAGGLGLEDLIQVTRARIVAATTDVPARRMDELRSGHGIYIDLQVDRWGSPSQPRSSALSGAVEADHAIVVGPSGAGKTTLLDELEYRLADGSSGRFPVRLRASDVAAGTTGFHPLAGRIPLRQPERASPSALLSAGAVHLMIDDLDEVPPDGQAKVTTWLRAIRRRYRRTRVTVCHRGADVPAELAGWTVIRLGAVTDEQIGSYLARFHAARSLSPGLITAVFDGPDGPRLRELARTPLLLWLLASTSQKPRPPVTAGDLIGAHIDQLESRPAVSGQLFSWAQALAEQQTESGEMATLGEEWLPVDPDQARKQLINLGILAANGTATRFRLRIYRDYFAARRLKAIAATRPDQLSALLLRFRWRDSFALFCSFSSTTTELQGQLVDAVSDADPCYAARLLRSAASPPVALTRSFAAAQERCLRDRAAGEVARARAARALAELDTPGSLFRLLGVVSDAADDPSAAELSLTALVDAVLAAGSGLRQRRLANDLTLEFGRLLDTAAPPMLPAILRAVGDLELRGLELLVADHLRRPGPWPVIQEARAALAKLGVVHPADLEDAWRRAQQGRLIEVERELLAASSAAEANQLQSERLRLLEADRGPGRAASLLERRFSFEIGHLVGQLIDQPGTGGLDGILGGPAADPDELLAAVDGTDWLTCAAAAHRLLGDLPDLSGRMFRMLTRNGGLERPLIAAAAVARLPAAELSDAAEYFGRVLESGDGDCTEALAVLAQAISAREPLAGVRLVRQAHQFLTEHHRADRLRWPWATALVRYGGTAAQLDALLSTGTADDQRLAIEALASAGFLLTAGQAPAHQFSDAARQRLLDACRGTTSDRAVVLLRAAAAMSMPEVLDVLFAGMTVPDVVATLDLHSASTLALAGYGLIEVTPAADALAAIGYLARLSVSRPVTRPGSTAATLSRAALAVHELLRGFDHPGAHPSVAIGRLIGLGYLGDWQPVLDALDVNPRMPAVARHTVELWVPGPYTPVGQAGQASVARWIAGRLTDPGVAPSARSILLDLKWSVEERAGALTPARTPGKDDDAA